MAPWHITISGISTSMIQRIKVHRQDCLLHSDKFNCYLHEYFPHWNICQVLLELRGTCKWKFRSWKCPDFQGSTILLSADLSFWKAGFDTSTDSCICCHPRFDKATICLAEITELRLASNYVYNPRTYLSSSHFRHMIIEGFKKRPRDDSDTVALGWMNVKKKDLWSWTFSLYAQSTQYGGKDL